jgi:hypothetical protein
VYIGEHVAAEGEGIHNEDLHYEGLLNAVGPNITEKNIHRFVKGFIAVCVNLNMWWERLAVETYYNKMIREQLTVTDAEVPDITRLFAAGAHG